MKTIAIAGASGFIGKNLIDVLLADSDLKIRALARSKRESHHQNLEWIQCDLFSVLDIEKAIEGVDTIIYLVHSMQPSAALDQASFMDYDLMLADNLGRAAKKYGIKRVIYLSGLIPDHEKLSDHLLSRLEVEEVLKEYLPDYTILRAGLILGREGSSFHILMNLVKRLPILVCPSWTQNLTSPVLVDSVVYALRESIYKEEHNQKVYDLGSSDSQKYYILLKTAAKYLSLNRIFLSIPISIIIISRLWVSLFSGASKKLIYPLLESLSHSLVPRQDHLFPGLEQITVDESIRRAVLDSEGYQYEFKTRSVKRNTVRSVQRSVLPANMNAQDVAQTYMKWLPKFMYPFIRVYVDGEWVTFCLINRKVKLLILKWSPERSTNDRQIFYVRGGLLAKKEDRGRLEFREVLNKRYMLAAIHDFKPSLPWYIYRYTQAIVHLIVMTFFGRYLASLNERK